MSAPDRIWLQYADTEFEGRYVKWSWCDHQVTDDDIEYHRAPDWVSVEDRLPKKQAYYNVIIENTPGVPYYDCILWTGKTFLKDTVYRHKIVKWLDMPLPYPPTGGDE